MSRSFLIFKLLIIFTVSSCHKSTPCPSNHNHGDIVSLCPQNVCPPCPVCKPNHGNHGDIVSLCPQPTTWRVYKVIDGDTIVVRLYLKDFEEPVRTERVRLLRINTPEKNQEYFSEASEALKTLISNGIVQLEFEKPGIEKRGNYGRLLAYVFSRGKNVNIEMVRLGWSKFWKKYGSGKYAPEFEKAQKEAENKKAGLRE